MASRAFIFPLFLWGLLLLSSAAQADWRTDSGFFALAAEGTVLPNGSAIEVLHAEADSAALAPYDYLPQAGGPGDIAGTDVFTGKTFHPLSGTGLQSGHAFGVGGYIYGPSSMAPGVANIYCIRAQDFFDGVYNGTSPATYAGKVQNHSWIGGADGSNVPVRKFDFMINRDQKIAVVGLNNSSGTTLPDLLGSSYHAISVGLRSGEHSRGGTIIDGAGRMKPDLVVNDVSTSLCTGGTSSAAILLCAGAVQSGVADADRPQVIKATLLAGASKTAIPAWRRLTTAKPYDDIFGAGELNIQNAWHIQAGGAHGYSTSVEVPAKGWNYTTATNAAAGRRYFFTVPAGGFANSFSAALVWHRTVNAFGTSSTVPNLSLKLYAAVNFTAGTTAIDQSVSAVDNVEHLFLRHLPAGQYMLEVTSGTNSTAYALAWEAQIGTGPRLTTTRGTTDVTLQAALLDPFVTYTLQSSSNLTEWANDTTVRTADATPATTYTWTLPESATTTRKFYRLSWPSPRS